VAFYTDKASLFHNAPKVRRNEKMLPHEENKQLPPTQIGRALQELGIVWIPAHSAEAKGRVERNFGTAQDRLVKGMRLARVTTLEQANRYLEQEYLPWWNETLTVIPASAADAHRPLGPGHDLASALSHVEHRRVLPDYTFRNAGKKYRILPSCIQLGMRGGKVRVEVRLDGSIAVRFRDKCLEVEEFQTPLSKSVSVKAESPAKTPAAKPKVTLAERTKAWRDSNRELFQNRPTVGAAAAIDRTRTRQSLD
jgi:hypothetical protein